MTYKKAAIIIISSLLFMIAPSSATEFLIEQLNQPSYINLTAGFNNLNDQIIINIPYQAMQDLIQ